MTKEQAKNLKQGDKIKYNGSGTIYTFEELDYAGDILTKETGNIFASKCEKLEKTIRDVEIGDVIEHSHWRDHNIIDVGKNGFVNDFDNYYTFEEAEKWSFKLKQPQGQTIPEYSMEEAIEKMGYEFKIKK